uniref:Uncharacterized protein n=1 Tax=Romanomermis culicivorax TaxID=13658 RepID=A0A915JNG2_ROMCU
MKQKQDQKTVYAYMIQQINREPNETAAYQPMMCVTYLDIRTDILKNGYPDVKKYPDNPDIFTVQNR